MPLIDHAPRIDNRRFEDIVAEARTRIPRYTPEWTDLNDNDPGMALVHVFAWMTDMLLYRLDRVPALNRLKFLELLGIELRPAQPARTEVIFPVGSSSPHVSVPLHQQVAAKGDDGEPVIFETERPLTAVRARLVAVQRYAGGGYSQLTAANEEPAQAWAPFGRQPGTDDALLLGFDRPLPAGIPLSLHVWTTEPAAAPQPLSCGGLELPVHVSAELAWEHWSGSGWQDLPVLRDGTRALTRSGHVELRTPEAGAMREARIGRVYDPRYWIRARLTRSAYQRPPELDAVRTNTVEVVQAQTRENDVLGGSDGTPDQRFRLRFAPVLADTLRLEVDEGERTEAEPGFHEWTRVDDFFGSGPDDRHYVLNRATGEVAFGDGVRGRIPVANPANANANVVARRYRHGGGARGNVPADSVTALLTAVPGIEGTGVRNLRPATGGRDEETLEEAELRAGRSVKSRCRAVTAEDFERHARAAGAIARARAFPLHHPDFPDVPVPGTITVVVVPEGNVPRPVPTEGTLRTVCAHLDRRRLLTTEVYVVGPTYREVQVRAELVAEAEAAAGDVREAVERSLRAYFDPLEGGEDGGGWQFGGTIYYSRVYGRVLAVPGVDRIRRLAIVLEGREQPLFENVPIPDRALLYSTSHEVRVEATVEPEAAS